jgi:hypothetical protein
MVCERGRGRTVRYQKERRPGREQQRHDKPDRTYRAVPDDTFMVLSRWFVAQPSRL